MCVQASAAQLAKASKTAAIRAEPKAYVAAKQGTHYYSLLTTHHYYSLLTLTNV